MRRRHTSRPAWTPLPTRSPTSAGPPADTTPTTTVPARTRDYPSPSTAVETTRRPRCWTNTARLCRTNRDTCARPTPLVRTRFRLRCSTSSRGFTTDAAGTRPTDISARTSGSQASPLAGVQVAAGVVRDVGRDQ